ncbi:MAG: TerB family tellurite resistance protein [Pseudomonadota bacterium]
MHILLAILGAAAAAFWAFRHFMNAANEGREAIGEVKGVIRRGNWSRRVDQRLIENLSDPREAAAILMYQIAAYDGDVTDHQKRMMVDAMRNAFEADEETAEGLYAFARMAVGEINDAGNSVRKILRPVAEVCTIDEKQQLIDLLDQTAEVEGAPSDVQRRLIAEARRVLLEG